MLSQGHLGHYGRPALLVAGVSLLALIVHLSVPYAYVVHDDGDGETVSRGDAADIHDGWDATPASAPATALTGIIITLVAGVGLVALGFAPLGLTAARWVGWGGGAVAAIGSFLALQSSLYWVGSGFGLAPYAGGFDFANQGVVGAFLAAQGFPFLGGITGGFTGLLELLLRTDNGGTVWIISPLLIAAGSIAAFVASLRIAGHVVRLEGGARNASLGHLMGGLWSAAFLAVVLVAPWSIGHVDDMNPGSDQDHFVYGAHTVLNMERQTDGESFNGMAYAIGVMTATAWVGLAASLVASLSGVLVSTGVSGAIGNVLRTAGVASAAMLLWSGVVYLLAWIYLWRPADGAQGFQPGWFAILLLPIGVLWMLHEYRIAQSAVRTVAEATAPMPAVSFD